MNSIALSQRIYRKTFALDGTTIMLWTMFHFQVKCGEFVALVGPTDQGKTTMLSILRFFSTSGQVLVDGRDLAQMNDKHRVKLRREDWFCSSQ
jgi:ABC-type lipoprotein export system ATPase subunit